MDALFSDRWRPLKAALAALAFVALCRHAHQEIRRTHAHLERMPTAFDTLRGRPISVTARHVTAADDAGLEFSTEVGPIRIVGQTSPPARPGDVVSAVGEIVGPRQIRADRIRLHPGYAWKRPLNYAVSALTLALFVGWAVRRFSLRFPPSLLRSRH